MGFGRSERTMTFGHLFAPQIATPPNTVPPAGIVVQHDVGACLGRVLIGHVGERDQPPNSCRSAKSQSAIA